MKERLLLVEDDPGMRRLTKVLLERVGYRVKEAGTAEEGLALIQKDKPDLLISDIQLPGISGVKLLEILRGEPATAGLPVILLTVLGKSFDKVRGLQTGADDYVTKPYEPKEFLARVEALLRRAGTRGGTAPSSILELEGIRMDLSSREVLVDRKPISLRRKEFELLALFLKHPGKLLTRDHITTVLWNDETIVTGNTLSVHIKNLRTQLGPRGNQLLTLFGEGYRFDRRSD
jgi:DNA-binding response OmpR family regulator